MNKLHIYHLSLDQQPPLSQNLIMYSMRVPSRGGGGATLTILGFERKGADKNISFSKFCPFQYKINNFIINLIYAAELLS